MTNLSILCADVGSIKSGNFGWAASLPDKYEVLTGQSIKEFADLIVTEIKTGHKVAIGFECPLFVPINNDPMRVNSARKGEGCRPWSAGAGTGALATGLVEVLWVMNEVAKTRGTPPVATLDWNEFLKTQTVYLWEAFVSSAAKGGGHAEDARTAVKSFLNALPDIQKANAIHEANVLSLVGAAALRAGWSKDIALLSQPCIVIKA
jgi:hypothetical protein